MQYNSETHCIRIHPTSTIQTRDNCYTIHPSDCYKIHPSDCYTIHPSDCYTIHPTHCYTIHLTHCYIIHPTHCYTIHPTHCYTIHPSHCLLALILGTTNHLNLKFWTLLKQLKINHSRLYIVNIN